jgi:Domain of unknown function (DUF4333)
LVTSPPTSRRHPIRLLRGALAPARLAAAGVLVCVGVAACGSSGPAQLNAATVARAIEQRIVKRDGITTAVRCAAPTVIKVGASFRCTAKLAVGTYAVNVVAIDAKGSFRYASAGPLTVLDSVTVEHAIARSIRRQRHLAATVSCPSPVLQGARISFGCVATTKRGTRHFKVTQLDGNGKVDIVDLTPKPVSTHTHTRTTTRHPKHSHTRTHGTTRSHTHTTDTHTAATATHTTAPTHTTATTHTHTATQHTATTHTHTTTTHTAATRQRRAVTGAT